MQSYLGEVEYLPEEELVPKYETVWQGVYSYPRIVGHTIQNKDRWARQCRICGKVKCTYKKNKPVPEYEF